MTKDATQQGVPAASDEDAVVAAEAHAAEAAEVPAVETSEEVPPAKPLKRGREDFLEQIAVNAEGKLYEELGIQPDATPETPAAEAAPEAPKPSAEQPTAQQPEIVDIDPNKLVRTVVDGQEQVMTWGEAQKRLQLEEASRRRFDEAARMRKEAEAERAALDAARTTPAKPEQQPGETDAEFHERVRKAVESMYSGDPDEATEILTDLLGRGRAQQSATPSPQIDVDQVANTVKARIEADTALKQFNKDYSDIVSDPYLVDIANRQFAAIKQANPGLSFEELLTESGNATRDWMKQRGLGATPANKEPSPEPQPSNVKQQRKESTDNVQSLTVVPSTNLQPPSEEEDRSNAIKELRKQRGQAG